MQGRLDESARLGGKATQDMTKLRMQVRLCYNTVINTGPGMGMGMYVNVCECM
jgi:hypothetical protein